MARKQEPSATVGITTAIGSVPITEERHVYMGWNNIKHSGLARAQVAITERAPKGDAYSREHSHQTVLQQHCDFFDLNGDGIITPYETFISLRLLQWSVILALLAVVVIHGGLAYFTLPPGRWLPDPFFRIYTAYIHAAKHGSDSGTYDHEGRFRPQQFADMFSKYGSQLDDGDFGMTYTQVLKACWGQRCVVDPFGISACIFEWSASYLTIWPADGIMRMSDVRAIYDGSYFYNVAGDRRSKYLS